ncbi:hypothetical protein [Tomitella biformata]|uniref:hypothetical protein n=1 Tax=Tomitella biformata TaxID=630403 RepID=UPI0004BC0DCA|nr:hypothetical protein [Tomitella biformata]
MIRKQTAQVFGVSTEILKDSYVDRGALDEKIKQYLKRDNHIAIRGASKSGKSWLRQRIIGDAITVQCRWGKSVADIYREALGQIGVKLVTSESNSRSMEGTVEGETEFGVGLIGKVKVKLGLTSTLSGSDSKESLRQNINDLDFICQLIRESGKRLIVEDFHYLDTKERTKLAYDLKTMWDLRLYVVIIGVWSDNNLLLNLNSELTGRVREVSVVWNSEELAKILEKGCQALNLELSAGVRDELVEIAYGNAGILQRLVLDTLDDANITRQKSVRQAVHDINHVHNAAMFYADELNSVYQTFASRVSSGIRSRKNSTGIYAHILAVALESTDDDLIAGVPRSEILRVSKAREPRIQPGNLKLALGNLERLQVDSDGRGLVLTYSDGRVRLVDQQLLVYRRFATVRWPWEDMIEEADTAGEDYSTVVKVDDLAG